MNTKNDVIVKIDNVKKIYPDGTTALKGVSIDIPKGSFFGLLGRNGAGKSTMVNIISSLIPASSGSISVAGYDLNQQPERCKQQLGIVPQEYNLNIFEKSFDIVTYQAGYYGIPISQSKQRIHELFELLKMEKYARTPSRALSGGYKRRLMIARALVHNPNVLILDEPTAGVDAQSRREMWDFLTALNRSGMTIILTTHYFEEAEALCDNFAIIDQGNLIHSKDKKALLGLLKQETFIISCRSIPKALKISDYTYTIDHDEATIEVCVDHEQTMNHLFDQLSKQKVDIIRLQNKTNRLEELFLNITKHEDTNG